MSMRLQTRGSRCLDEVVASVLAKAASASGLADGEVERLLGAVEKVVAEARRDEAAPVDVAIAWDDTGLDIAVGDVTSSASARSDGRLTLQEGRQGLRAHVSCEARRLGCAGTTDGTR